MEELGEIPQVVGSYRILGVIGAGAMGAVLRAEHTLIGRGAAVKILRPECSVNRDIVTRFFNEARAATAIKHPGIVEIYDYGHLPSGAAYLVMELLEGQSLRARIQTRGRLTESEAFGIVRGIASALAAAHAKGIVHRDIKPDNIFLIADPEQPSRERVKLLDFGIAKLSADHGLDGSATRSGAVMGTPSYMAPEQCRGAGRVDHRADLYAVGCVLMHLLTGAPPFVVEGVGEIIGAHLFVPPPTLRSRLPGASELADHLVARLLAKDPDQRVQTALELVELVASAGPSSSAIVSGSMWLPSRGDLGAPITTLGSGAYAGSLTGVPRRRRWWPLVAAAAVVAVAAVVVLAAVGAGGGADATSGSPSSTGSGSGSGSVVAPAPTTTPPAAGSAGAAPVIDAGVDAPPAAPIDTAPPAAPPPPIDAAPPAAPPPPIDAGPARKPRPPRPPRPQPPDELMPRLGS